MGKNIIALVIKKLKEYDIEIFGVEEDTIHFSSGILNINKKNDITITYHVSTKPDFAAVFVLIIREIKYIRNILISELFIVHKDDFIYGDEAVEKWEAENANKIINDFMKHQELTHWLVTTQNCGNS